MKVSPNLFVLVLTILFIPGIFASFISGDIYSVEGDHLGIAGNALQGESYSFRDSLTYQYPVNKYPISGIYSLSFGWYKSESSSSTEGGGTITTTSGGSSGGGGCSYNESYDWECSEWSKCIDNIRMRTCKEKNNCGNSYGRPEVERSCEGETNKFDITWNLEDSKIENASELVGIVIFENFGTVPTFVNLTFIVLDSYGNEVYRAKGNTSITTEGVIRWTYENLELSEGDYIAILETLYDVEVYYEFRQGFKIGEKENNYWKYFIGGFLGMIILIILIIFFYKYKSKKMKYRRSKNVGEYKKKVKEKLGKIND